MGEGVYQLRSSANSKLTATPGSSGLTLNAVGSGKNQQFRLDYHASGYYTITCQENGLRLTAGKNGVTLAKASTDNGQLWKAAVYNSGFSLQNRGTGSYLSVSSNAAGGRLILADTAMQWQLALAGAGWTLDGASYPTVNSTLTVGQTGFPFRGTLRNAYDIRRVTVSIQKSNGSNAISPATATPNAKSYDLSRLDDAVAFSRLGVGGYTLVIAAENTAGDNYRLESKFYVTDGSYVVSFDPCGGTCSESTRLVSAGQKYGNLPTAVKDGCAFVGWFTQPDGGQQITANSTTGASNITLYAHYQGQYTYQFVNYDGSVYAQGKLTAGQTIPRPAGTPTRPADSQYTYTFTGWQGYTNGMTISGNVTFTAQYAAKAVESVPKEITTGAYRIADSYLRAIPMGTTARQLLANLSPSDYITLPVQGDSLVGTRHDRHLCQGRPDHPDPDHRGHRRPQRRRPGHHYRYGPAPGSPAGQDVPDRRGPSGGGPQRRRSGYHHRYGPASGVPAGPGYHATQLSMRDHAMRKNISSALAGFLAALLLWCLLPVTAEAAGASFSGSGSVRAGDSVTVTFSVSGSNIQGITAVLHYDSSTLTLTGTRQLIGDSWSVDMSGGNLLAYDQSLNNPISGSSAVLAVTFRVKSGVAAGTKVSATITDIVTSDGNSDQSLNDASWSASVASPPSGNANLSGLSCGSYALSPSFSAGTTEYSVTVPYDVSRLPLDYSAADGGANVSVSGNQLSVGVNTVVLTVTAANGATRRYTISVTRQPDPTATLSSDADLADLTPSEGKLTPAFAPNITEYAVYVPYETTKLSLSATAKDSKALGVTQPDAALKQGDNVLTVTCTAEDGHHPGLYGPCGADAWLCRDPAPDRRTGAGGPAPEPDDQQPGPFRSLWTALCAPGGSAPADGALGAAVHHPGFAAGGFAGGAVLYRAVRWHFPQPPPYPGSSGPDGAAGAPGAPAGA